MPTPQSRGLAAENLPGERLKLSVETPALPGRNVIFADASLPNRNVRFAAASTPESSLAMARPND